MENAKLSSANQAYINSNKANYSNAEAIVNSNSPKLKPNLSQDSVEFTNKKSNNKKAITIGIVLGSVAAIGGFLAKKKLNSSKIKQLAEFIDFKPAQTMDEAIEFARKNFGIETFDFGEDIELANWANEGLTNLNNKAKGKIHMPKSIYLSDELDEAMGSMSQSGDLKINPKAFNTENNMETINQVFKIMDTGNIPTGFLISKDSIRELIETYNLTKANPNYKFSRTEAHELAMLAENIITPFKYPMTVFQAISQDENLIKVLKKYNIELDITKFSKLTEKEQTNYLSNIFSTINIGDLVNTNLYPKRFCSKFDILYHEMGHLQHYKNTSLFSQLFGKFSDKSKQVAKFTQNPQMQKTASKISWYAQTHPSEFVAETYAKLCNGIKLPDDVMELYKKLNGVLI
ncbi:hypothetical protein IJ425_03540 [bacterium]|nr:hypothetical protein [bacterium]